MIALDPNTTVILALAIGLAAALGLWTILAFNRLVREGWSGIDVQLRRRHNLIPNLVETVRGYGRHEKTVFDEVASSRSAAAGAAEIRERQDRENALTAQLKGLFAVAEAYPDLKANTTYLRLQDQLAEIEDQIQMARRYYNGTVRDFNIRVESFPSNLVARLFGFRPADFFQVESATERAVPKVET